VDEYWLDAMFDYPKGEGLFFLLSHPDCPRGQPRLQSKGYCGCYSWKFKLNTHLQAMQRLKMHKPFTSKLLQKPIEPFSIS
jgi:hypothetical protein